MKKIFTTIITVFLIITIPNVYASPKTFDRNTLENYGVNKNLGNIETKVDEILKTKAVDASEKVYDFAELLTDEEEQKLKEEINSFVKKTKIDMAIVTDSFFYSYDNLNEKYATDFYNYNDFGLNFKNHSGILLFRNAYAEDPYYNLYTFGKGMLYFDYDRLESMLDLVYNDMTSANYYEGFSNFIEASDKYYKSGIPYKMRNYKINTNGELEKTYAIPWEYVLPISFVITLIVIIILINKNKMVQSSWGAGAYIDEADSKMIKSEDIYINERTTSYTRDTSSSYSGSGSSSSSSRSHGSGSGRHG